MAAYIKSEVGASRTVARLSFDPSSQLAELRSGPAGVFYLTNDFFAATHHCPCRPSPGIVPGAGDSLADRITDVRRSERQFPISMNSVAFTCSKPQAADFLKDGSPRYLLSVSQLAELRSAPACGNIRRQAPICGRQGRLHHETSGT